MKKQINNVKQFHEAFKIYVSETPTLSDYFNLLYDLMKEENDEYLEACKNGDLVEISDALGD